MTLIGGGGATAASLTRALSVAPRLVAADGGADAALALGVVPDMAVGDFDSISAEARETLGVARLHHNPDQNSTDFDKALAAVPARLVMAVGFAGLRLDHTLAATATLARNPHRQVILDTGHDLCLICPSHLTLSLPAQSRVSLFPLAPVRCASEGLVWPTDGLDLSPTGQIGTSNAAVGGTVTLTPDAPALLLLLPVEGLVALLAGLRDAPLWPAPARAG